MRLNPILLLLMLLSISGQSVRAEGCGLTTRRFRRGARAANWASAAVLGLTFLLVQYSPASPSPHPSGRTNSQLTAASFSCASLLTGADVNATVWAVYNHTSGSGSWPARSGVDSSVLTMFNSACAQSSFQSLAQGFGAGNFSLELYTTAGGVSSSNFTFDWNTWQSGLGPSTGLLVTTEWWTGYLSNGTVAGPTSISPGRSMVNGIHASRAWAGYEYWGPGSTPPALVNESGFADAITFSPPACSGAICQLNVPGNVTIDPVAVTWTGLENVSGNPSGALLLQTGFVYDEANVSASYCTGAVGGCNYTYFWQSGPNFAHPYAGAPHTAHGHWIREQVFFSGYGGVCGTTPRWTTEVTDETIHASHSRSHCLEFRPTYAPMIYDAPWLNVRGSYAIQQTPKFGTSELQDSYVSTAATVYSVPTLLTPPPLGTGTSLAYTMSEKFLTYNTQESWSAPCGTSYLPWVAPSCQDVAWLTSMYDYTYV